MTAFADLQDLGRVASGLEPGRMFPDLVLPSVADESPLSLAHFRGQKVLLHIWASW